MMDVNTNTSLPNGPSLSSPVESVMTPSELGEIIAAFNDVTLKLERSHEQLRSEVARLQDALSEANVQVERSRRLAALGEMAAGIAHEVRNPLGSIRLYARMLEQDLADREGERQMASKIAHATGAIEAIVGDVLTFAKEFKLQRFEVDCRDALERAIEACRSADVAGWDGIQVVLDSACEARFEGDPGLVQQALVNVIRNAFEAMVESGSKFRVLRLGAERRPRNGQPAAVIRVQDSGPGVTSEVVARMFNPFFTTRGTGTGLGLAIVHRIMDAHGGAIVIQNNRERSEAGVDEPGACVELVFPARASARGEADRRAA